MLTAADQRLGPVVADAPEDTPAFDYIDARGVWRAGQLLPLSQMPDCVLRMLATLVAE